MKRFVLLLACLPALVFCGMCIFMLYSSLEYARWLALLGAAPLLVGVPLAWLGRPGTRSEP